MAIHNLLGEEGEKVAVEYLKSKGYIIYHTNWRLGRLEIDVIAEDGKELVFIEVKTRSSEAYGRPEEFVDAKKEIALITAADIYVRDFIIDINVRFDIISVLIKGKATKINHLMDSFSGFEQEY